MVKYLNIEKASENWNTEAVLEDFLYEGGPKESDTDIIDISRIKDGKRDTANGFDIIEVENLPDARVKEIFRLIKACEVLSEQGEALFGGLFPDEITEYFESKGKIYSEIKAMNFLEFVDRYVKEGSKESWDALILACKAHRKKTTKAMGGKGVMGVEQSDREVDIASGLLQRLSDLQGVRAYCQELFNNVRGKVIGQDSAIRDVVLKLVSYVIDPSSQSAPILASGPTGVGKTYSIRIIAKEMGIPFEEISTPELAPASYKGTTIQEVFFNAIAKRIGEFEGYPNRVILYLDEFGKLLFRGNETGGNFSRQIQSELLKLLEPGAKIKNSGFFGGIQEIPLKAMIVLSDALSFITPEAGQLTRNDLVKAGFITELAGRIQLVHAFKPLTVGDFEQILLKGENTELASKVRFCSNLGVSLVFERPAIKAIAELAEKDGAGGRSLNHIVNTVVDMELSNLVFGSDRTKVNNMLRINRRTVERTFPGNGKSVRGFGFRTI